MTKIEEALGLVKHPETKWEESTVVKVREAVSLLSDAVNCMGGGDVVSKALAGSLLCEHRTLQASIIRAFQGAMEIYQEATPDLRNMAAVEFARKVSLIDVGIPLI